MPPLIITTPRLVLIAATEDLVRDEMHDRAALARKLGATVPKAWPPELNDLDTTAYFLARLRESPASTGWWAWYFVLRDEQPGKSVLVGNGGFKGPPSSGGTVEVGYSVLAGYQRRGIGTEATQGLLTWAFEHTEVLRVIAETLPEFVASIKVLERVGFRLEGEGTEPGVVRYTLARALWRDA